MKSPLNILLALSDAGFFCVGIAALFALYFMFKAISAVLKLILLLATLAVISGVAWWFLSGNAP